MRAPAPEAVKVTPELIMQLRRPVDLAISADGRTARVHRVSVVPREGPDPALEALDRRRRGHRGGRRRCAAAVLAGRNARVRLGSRPPRPHERVDRRPRRAREPSPARSRTSSGRRTAARCSCSPRISAPTEQASQTATKIKEAGAEEEDPKVFRPAAALAPALPDRRGLRRDRRGEPRRRQRVRVRLGGGKVAAVCTDEPSESAWYDAWIGLIDLELGSVERVHTPEWQLQCPRISPGGRIAWIEGFSSDRATLTGTVHLLGVGPLAPELDVTWFDVRRREHALVRRLAAQRLDGRPALRRRDVRGALRGRRSRRPSLPAQDLAERGRIQHRNDLREPVRPAGGRLPRGRRPAAGDGAECGSRARPARLRLADVHLEVLRRARDRRHARAPAGLRGGALPLLVEVHGGPTGTWSLAVRSLERGPQLLVSDGYAVFFPNPRGSSGRGQEFARANLGDMGGGDLKDILAGVDALVPTASRTTRRSRSPAAATAASCRHGR